MKVMDIAYSRTGDKGDFALISVICKDPKDYALIKEKLTVEKVKDTFSEICMGKVKRYEVPKISAFIYELEHALGGGVTRTLALDPHGKSLSYIMLDIDL